jgi:hypothetical protein
LLALALVSAVSAASADVSVWLDFTNFSSRLDELTTAAGVDPFSASEQTTIRTSIQSRMAAVYWNFTVSFTDTAPSGDHETVHFGNTTGDGGLLGQAQEIDWLNRNKNDVANVYTSNFAFIIDEFSDSVNRSQQLDELTAALGGTAAHELAHNLGLQHFDCYGDPRIGPANYANTQGYQNEHIMATGPTGLDEAGREQDRDFCTLELAKLEYGDGLTDHTPDTYLEPGGAHDTPATALALPFTYLPIAGVQGFNMVGTIGAAGQYDYYSFTGQQNERLTANTLSQVLFSDPVNSYLSLYGPDGSTLLASNNDIYFSGNTFNGGSYYSDDSILLNYLLPQTGTYYLQVRDAGTDTGYYDFFVTLDDTSVPEPATLALAALALLGAVVQVRRKKRKSG